MERTKIQGILFEKGISQAQVAKTLGITQGQLSKKLRGEAPLLWREVVMLCELLQMDNPLLGIFPNK